MSNPQTVLVDDRLDLVFGALSNRTRRRILADLERGPANITELADPHSMSLPAVSKHLRVLERAGLVTRNVDGRIHRCALNAGPLRTADEWLNNYRTFWDETLDALARHVGDDR